MTSDLINRHKMDILIYYFYITVLKGVFTYIKGQCVAISKVKRSYFSHSSERKKLLYWSHRTVYVTAQVYQKLYIEKKIQNKFQYQKKWLGIELKYHYSLILSFNRKNKESADNVYGTDKMHTSELSKLASNIFRKIP